MIKKSINHDLISDLQLGQSFYKWSHFSKHALWNRWLHSKLNTFSYS